MNVFSTAALCDHHKTSKGITKKCNVKSHSLTKAENLKAQSQAKVMSGSNMHVGGGGWGVGGCACVCAYV